MELVNKRVARVKFPFPAPGYNTPTNRLYNFVTNITYLTPGNLVVVNVENDSKFAIGEFVEYVNEDLEFPETFGNKNARWIIQRIDLCEHNRRITNEKRLIELRKKMEIRRQKAAELEIFEILAKNDPEMQRLLNEFKHIQGGNI